MKYGLNVNLDECPSKLIAVPFDSKDSPTKTNDFSHLDVCFGFTLLSFLYRGIHENLMIKLIKRFDHIYPKEDANTKFNEWVQKSHEISGVKTPSCLISRETFDDGNMECISAASQYIGRNIDLVFFCLNQFSQKTAMNSKVNCQQMHITW